MISLAIVSKDERGLDETLTAAERQCADLGEETEIIVVDASRGRLSNIASAHPAVRWIDFVPPPGVRISIPHQRNCAIRAARGELIVFTDAGCHPHPGWLVRLVDEFRRHGERVVAGLAVAPEGSRSHYRLEVERIRGAQYLDEAPTVNLAVTRAALVAVGGFDEHFEYGSDVDLTWRLVDHGFRIRSVPDAVVEHHWGTGARQLRRAFQYGQARARLYRKHASRRPQIWKREPVLLAYPLFILGLPLTLRVPLYPLLLLVPAWRARRDGAASVVADHLAYGAGALTAVLRPGPASRPVR